jgi:hypothetical protein
MSPFPLYLDSGVAHPWLAAGPLLDSDVLVLPQPHEDAYVCMFPYMYPVYVSIFTDILIYRHTVLSTVLLTYDLIYIVHSNRLGEN